MRGVVKGKCWLLLTRWMNLDSQKRQQLNKLFALNRRVRKACLRKESLERLWTHRYEGAMLRQMQSWIEQRRWQRLVPFQNFAYMLLESFGRYSQLLPQQSTLRSGGSHQRQHQNLLRRGRGYKNLSHLLLKAQRIEVTKTEFIVLQKAA